MFKFLVVVTCLAGNSCPVPHYELELRAKSKDECVSMVVKAVEQYLSPRAVKIVCEAKK